MTPQKTDPTRSAVMRSVKSKDTYPEMYVRRTLHSLGFRYRLHRRDLPGTPDIVFPRLRKVVLVHGCFWHGHTCRRGNRVPENNRPYWIAKVRRNIERDVANCAKLAVQRWQIFVVWECQVGDPQLIDDLKAFLADRWI